MEIKSAELLLRIRPMSKARPRAVAGSSRPYMDKVYTEWKAKARALMGEWWADPPLDHINCLIVHFRGPARGDLDNRLGALLDAGNDLIWKDDNVNVIRSVAMRWDKESTADAHIYMKLVWEVR